jgi:hypothetical protein
MHFLVEGATFAPGTDLQLWRFSLPLAPLAQTETSEMCVSGIMRDVAAEVTARGMVPLLSFTDFTDMMSALDGHFEPALAHDPETFTAIAPFFSPTFGHLPKTFVAASSFRFFKTSAEMGTGRDA